MEKINQTLLNLNYDELKSLLIKEKLVTTLVYTPTCGTCHVAKKMLEVVKAAKPDLLITMINFHRLWERLRKTHFSKGKP